MLHTNFISVDIYFCLFLFCFRLFCCYFLISFDDLKLGSQGCSFAVFLIVHTLLYTVTIIQVCVVKLSVLLADSQIEACTLNCTTVLFCSFSAGY